MGKWGKYPKSFQMSWLKDPLFAKWLTEVKDDGNKAHCKVCETDIRAHRSDLKKHSESLKHRQNISKISDQQMSIKSVLLKKEDKLTSFEIRLSVYVACHSSIQSIDHLSELLKAEMPSTSSASSFNLRLHRTKCSALIKKVIAPVLLSEQVNDLKNTPFSLIIDESTDIACEKHLCICVRYYNARRNRMSSQFLGLVSVVSTTSEALYKYIKDYFGNIGVDLKQCFAIGTDGASNLCGSNHSLYTLMKKDIPNLILIKCTCHSLHLACSHASDELPSNIDFMIRESYNWFHRSALRRESYLEIYRLINDGKDPLQLIPLSGTRWLARSNSVKRLLDQWDSLTIHFQIASSSCDKYVARQLFTMYSDPANKLYLTFLKPILNEFERINLLYQKDEADQCSLHTELENFTIGMLRRIVHHDNAKLNVNLNFNSIYLPMEKVDFGYEFSVLLSSNKQNKAITQEKLHDIQHRCHKFLVRACKELLSRISSNGETLKKVQNLSPSVCLSHTRPPFSELPLVLADQSKIGEIESQWRLLLTIDWANIFEGPIPTSGSSFWTKAVTIKDAAGDFMLIDLAEFALKMYSLPISNALVERVFSRVTSVKTKLRNRMGLELLTSILRIKTYLEENETCCSLFQPPTSMLKYDSSIYKNEDVDEEEEDLLDNLKM